VHDLRRDERAGHAGASRECIVTWVGDKAQSVSDLSDAFDSTSRAAA
jgi:hypothetical protein